MTGRKLSDVERWQAAGMVIGGMSYRQTAERFNVSHSVIVRLKQRVNQTGNVKKTPPNLSFAKVQVNL
jgi:transposase